MKPSKTTTWCWPSPLNHNSDSDKILTGSLYFASLKGPLSEASFHISRYNYDIIGIIFKTKEYYVYTILNKGIEIIPLNDLLTDHNLGNHSILQIKDSKFNTQRINILKDLFKYYHKVNINYDLYTHLASIVGYPIIKKQGVMTSSQLVGLILFQAGLIWDDKFITRNKNPVACFDKCFFLELAEQTEGEYEAIVKLVPPKNDWFEMEQNVINFYQESNKQRYSKSEWIIYPDYQEPCQKFVYARTLVFENLKPSDFLSQNIKPQEHIESNADPILIATICSLATRRSGQKDINKLNMSWYHNNLKFLKLDTTQTKFQDYSDQLKSIIPIVSDDFNKRYLSHLNGDLLLMICKSVSELGLELHKISEECNSKVKYNRDSKSEYKFNVLLDSGDRFAEYLIILNKYMWGNNWKYHWDNPLQSKNIELSERIKTLIKSLNNLKDIIPSSCIILELVMYLLEQSHRLYTYTCKYRKIKYKDFDYEHSEDIMDELFH